MTPANGAVPPAVPLPPDAGPTVDDPTGTGTTGPASATTLATFLRGTGGLTLDERTLIVGQALVLLEQNYVHLPLKTAMYAVNPVQRLRLLRRRLERQRAGTMPVEWLFHAELSDIFHSVRDLHTNYLLPEPFSGAVAFLPFLVEECFDTGGPHYLVTHIAEGFTAPQFEPGVEVTHWNGIPIRTAIDLNAARFAGSNPAARRSRGLESLTLRPLLIHLPPSEEWVTLSYVGVDGRPAELRQDWQVMVNPPPPGGAGGTGSAALDDGVDLETDETGRAKIALFAPQVIARERAAPAPPSPAGGTDSTDEVVSSMPRVFRARTIRTPSGTFGHLRIFTFSTESPAALVGEFVRLLDELPQNGLVIDVRDNGGGSIGAAESLLQTLTPRRISPEPMQFINTPLNLRLCRGNPALGVWVPSMEQATEIGATFSGAFPLTSDSDANAIGQQYFGPVVLVTNARCYSATDIFSAGFQDHRIGAVLGTDENTGAGGANVWTHQRLLAQFADGDGSPYTTLPRTAGMRVAIRRTLRVGAQSGTPVEDLGVAPDALHQMTRRDLLEDNVDLLAEAGRILAARPRHELAIRGVSPGDASLTLSVRTEAMDRLDVYVDDRPRASVDVVDGETELGVPGVVTTASVRIDGFSAGELVGRRRVVPSA
ncbi:hypothetical protein GCM10010222_49440 [Streptomyces tanashiensis]|uniref:S41 family peptidase n=1 Tax=Streptomyces tanashiensis TaxID=67367 RepID=UPI001674B02B|nr:S41 family peptidase [Streptomyces tanashiensis]GGT01847.1 hypothetical protein GCM10010222_49440 [Streptomyces tanashiensis]